MKRILLVGGGGHCRSVIDTLKLLNIYDDIGILDNAEFCYGDIQVVGTDGDVRSLHDKGWTEAFVTVGSVGNTAKRRQLYDMIKREGFTIPAIIDPTAIVSDDAVVAEGVFAGKGVIINSGSVIGECAIINTGAIVEHDCVIGQFAHISSGSILCGQVKIGDNTHIGAGSVVKQSINIGIDTMIGAGSTVVKDIPDKVKAYGNPCRVIA